MFRNRMILDPHGAMVREGRCGNTLVSYVMLSCDSSNIGQSCLIPRAFNPHVVSFLSLPVSKVPDQIEDTDTCVGLSRHVDFKGFDLLVSVLICSFEL